MYTNNTNTMTEPKVTMKNVKYHQGHEWQGVNADVYINGVKVYHVHDDGNGGCLDIHLESFDAKTKALAVLLNDYVDSIPAKPLDFGNGVIKDDEGNVRMDKLSLEDYLNNILTELEHQKAAKKMEKQMVDAILFGVPNSNTYTRIRFTIPLSKIPTLQLQIKVNEIKKKHCVDGVQILNSNLQALGINI